MYEAPGRLIRAMMWGKKGSYHQDLHIILGDGILITLIMNGCFAAMEKVVEDTINQSCSFVSKAGI